MGNKYIFILRCLCFIFTLRPLYDMYIKTILQSTQPLYSSTSRSWKECWEIISWTGSGAKLHNQYKVWVEGCLDDEGLQYQVHRRQGPTSLPQEASRSPTGTGPVPWLSVRSVVTRRALSSSLTSFPSSVWSVKSPITSRLISAYSYMPSWPPGCFRGPPRRTLRRHQPVPSPPQARAHVSATGGVKKPHSPPASGPWNRPIGLFEDTNLCGIYTKRVTIMPWSV